LKRVYLILSIFLCYSFHVQAGTAELDTPKLSKGERTWKDRSYQQRGNESRYEDRYTFKHGKPFVFDPFIWTYSKEFAERYHMPKEWIDPNLKGALAVAWRMTNIGETTCGLAGRAENCWRPLDCQMDVYYDNSIKLPWNYDVIRDNVTKGLTSTRFLHSTPETRSQRYGAKWRYRTDHNGSQILTNGPLKYGKYNQTGGYLASFDREFEPGIGVISWIGGGYCPPRDNTAPVELDFLSEEDWQKHRRGKVKEQDISVVHKIKFSKAYMKRILEAYEQLNN